MLKFSGFLGYPEAEYVLVDLTIEGLYFGQGILTREVWEKLKLLNRPAVRLSDSIIQVMERGNSKEGISLVTKVKENDPGSQKSRRGSPEISSISATDESSEQGVNGDTLTEEAWRGE